MTISKKKLEHIEKRVRHLKITNRDIDPMITVPWPIDMYSEEGEKYIQDEIARIDKIRKEYGVYTEDPYYVIMPGKTPQWAAEEEWRKQQEAEKLK